MANPPVQVSAIFHKNRSLDYPFWLRLCRVREDESLRELPEYRLLERLLAEHCTIENDGNSGGSSVVLKDGKETASDSLQSPFDPEASYDGHKGVGYQVQLSETCVAGNAIQVITHVAVEPAHHSDQHALLPALDDLAQRGCVPETLFADTAYNSGDNLIAAAERGVNLMAPTPGKGDADGIALGHFDLDLETLQVRGCPEGERPVRDRLGKDGETHNLRFDAERCGQCGLVLDCPAGKHGGSLRVQPPLIPPMRPLCARRFRLVLKFWCILVLWNRVQSPCTMLCPGDWIRRNIVQFSPTLSGERSFYPRWRS